MNTREMLLEEIEKQPEPILRELWLYLRYLARHEAERMDVLRHLTLEREAMDIMADRRAAVANRV